MLPANSQGSSAAAGNQHQRSGSLLPDMVAQPVPVQTAEPDSPQQKGPQSCPAWCLPSLSPPPLSPSSRLTTREGLFWAPPRHAPAQMPSHGAAGPALCICPEPPPAHSTAVLTRTQDSLMGQGWLCALLQPQTRSCSHLLSQRQVQELGLQLMAECKREFLHLGRGKRRRKLLYEREPVAETQSSVLQSPKVVPGRGQGIGSAHLLPASCSLEGNLCADENKSPEKPPPSSRDTSSNALSDQD